MSEKIGRFPIRRILGKGSCGNVVAVEDVKTGCFYAVKSVFMDMSNSGDVLKELELMCNKDLIDPFLVRYYAHFFEKGRTHVFMEYCEKGDLEHWVKSCKGHVGKTDLLRILKQILRGILVLHKHGIIHGDLKPQNVLLNAHDEVKVGDFGTSKKMSRTLNYTGGIQGTLGFIPAEVIGGAPPSTSSDVFAIGCTMYYVATKHLPFEASAFPKLMEGIYPPIERADLPEEVKQLVYLMIAKDANRRPSVEELLADALLNVPSVALSPRMPVPAAPALFGSDSSDGCSRSDGGCDGDGGGASKPGPERSSHADVPVFASSDVDVAITAMIKAIAAHNPSYGAVDFRREFEGVMDRKPTPAEVTLFLSVVNQPTAKDIPAAFRPNPRGGCAITRTPMGEMCVFTPPMTDGQKWRTIFLDSNITEGIFRWTIKTKYAPAEDKSTSSFFVGVAPSDLLTKCDDSKLEYTNGTCWLWFRRSADNSLEAHVGGVTDASMPKETPVPDNSVVAVEVDVNKRTVSFFVGGVKVPRTVSGVHVPLHFGVSVYNKNSSVTSLSLQRLPSATPSTVTCTLHMCKLK